MTLKALKTQLPLNRAYMSALLNMERRCVVERGALEVSEERAGNT